MLKHIAEPLPTRTVGPGTLEPSWWHVECVCGKRNGTIDRILLHHILIHDVEPTPEVRVTRAMALRSGEEER